MWRHSWHYRLFYFSLTGLFSCLQRTLYNITKLIIHVESSHDVTVSDISDSDSSDGSIEESDWSDEEYADDPNDPSWLPEEPVTDEWMDQWEDIEKYL